ncbi:MAG TPA: TraK family protein [Chryseosolibacter sp.]|jgi:hypothetical protein
MTKEVEPVRGAGRVAFWAREKEIREMIDAKHTKKSIYRKYGAEMNISYEQFARYVKKFIEEKQDEAKLQPANKESEARKPSATDDSRPRFKQSKKRTDLY